MTLAVRFQDAFYKPSSLAGIHYRQEGGEIDLVYWAWLFGLVVKLYFRCEIRNPHVIEQSEFYYRPAYPYISTRLPIGTIGLVNHELKTPTVLSSFLDTKHHELP